MSDAVLFERHGAIATLTLNRPETLNVYDGDMAAGLDSAVARCIAEPGLRAVIVTGAGKHFMAGGNIRAFRSIIDHPEAEIRAAFAPLFESMHRAIHGLRVDLKVPVIAKVRGAAAGFGLSLALACDLVVAADDSYYTSAYSNLGTSPDGSMTWMLPRLVGLKKAMEIILLAERFDAATALSLGLINRVVPAAELDGVVDALALRLATGPTLAYAKAKALLNQAHETGIEQQLRAEAQAFQDCTVTKDFAEGVTAFLEKRAAVFTGE